MIGHEAFIRHMIQLFVARTAEIVLIVKQIT
jgi:hypothetical protein